MSHCLRRLWPLVLLTFLPPLLLGQTDIRYVEAKAKFKGRGESRYLRWIKIYSLDGEADVYLRHRSKATQARGEWYLVDDPGGTIEVYNWQPDTLCGTASRGQERVWLTATQDADTWGLGFMADSFWLDFSPPGSIESDLSQQAELFRWVEGPDGQRARATLLTLTYLPSEPRYLTLRSSKVMHDMPPLAGIMSVLVAFVQWDEAHSAP